MRLPTPTWTFALVVARQGDDFLLVHERKHGQRWYLPAGRVEPGETIVQAALRETREETGVDVELDGVLRVEYTPMPEGAARLRVIFTAHPAGDATPRSQPDDESLGAAWVSLAELDELPLRGDDVREVFEYVSRGGPIYPMHLMALEGAAWTAHAS